jgi:hypothetical protein
MQASGIQACSMQACGMRQAEEKQKNRRNTIEQKSKKAGKINQFNK